MHKLFLSIVPMILLVLAGAYVFFGGPRAQAIEVDASLLNLETSCDTGDDTSFTGLLPLPVDTYSVYVRLPTAGQTADVRVWGQVDDESSSCVAIGSVGATGDQWTLVGSWTSELTDVSTILQLTSPALNSTLGANRPSLMIISQTNPTCVPTIECTVTIENQTGYVRPIGTLPNQDSLHIVRPIDPMADTIKRVTYYVDREPLYTTPLLEEFDMRFVTHRDQELARVIEYESGQRVVLDQEVKPGHVDNFWNFIFRIGQSNPTAYISILGIIGFAILAGIIAGIIKTIQRHRVWRLNHGLAKEKVVVLTDADRRRAFEREHRRAIAGRVVQVVLVVASVMVFVVMLNSLVVQLYKVDGESMESTYSDGSQIFINKVPITWAQIAGYDYTPERGEVVVLRQIFGITDDVQSVANKDAYLIKRVIGLPGERVVVMGNEITVYNEEYPDGFNPDTGSPWEATMFAEESAIALDITLGKDEIFIAGDNRPESIDSRLNGAILTKQIVGTVQ